MQAIEFEAIPYQHTIRIPDEIPDGVSIRVLVYVDDKKETVNREEYNARSPDYLTMAVNEIDIPTREQRYER